MLEQALHRALGPPAVERAMRAVWRPGPRGGDQTEVLFFQLGRAEKAVTRHVLIPEI